MVTTNAVGTLPKKTCVMTSIFAGKFGVGTLGLQPKVTMFVTFNGDWRF